MIKLRTKEDIGALMEMLRIITIVFVFIYMIGSVGALENDHITMSNFITRLIVSVILIIL